MKEYTVARANKELEFLAGEKRRLLDRETERCTYVVEEHGDVEPPRYDYGETRSEVAEIDRRIARLRHAVHVFGSTAILPESRITLDEARIRLSLMGGERRRVDALRSIPTTRRMPSGLFPGEVRMEQERANYDVERADRDYRRLCVSMADLQVEVGAVEHTMTFTVAP